MVAGSADAAALVRVGSRRRRSQRFFLSGEPLEARIVPAAIVINDTEPNNSTPQQLPPGNELAITGTLLNSTDIQDSYILHVISGQTITLETTLIEAMGSIYCGISGEGVQVGDGQFPLDFLDTYRDKPLTMKAGKTTDIRIEIFDGSGPPLEGWKSFYGFTLKLSPDSKDIQAKPLEWDTAKKGVTISYENTVKLDKSTKGALYWATGTTVDSIIDKSKPAHTFNLDKTVGTHDKFVAFTGLKKPPAKNKGGVTEATHLVLVLDPVSSGKPQGAIVESDETNNVLFLTRKFDRDAFLDEAIKRFGKLSQSQREGLTYLIDNLAKDFNVVADPRQVAYMLATTKWETVHSFNPVTELPPKSIAGDAAKVEAYFNEKYSSRTDLGNTEATDGFSYRGRGYVQITGRANYKRFGGIVGVDLETTPDAALNPETAYTIMTSGMRQGLFTGKSLSDYITDDKTDYVNARRIINGTDKASTISAIAKHFETILRNSVLPK